jgi:hypothetical protein
VARQLVQGLGETLGAQARAAAREVGLALDGLDVVANGGLFAHPSSALFEALETSLPEARVTRAQASPVVGALMLAYDRMALHPDRKVVADSARITIDQHQVRLAPLSPLSPRKLVRRARRGLQDILARLEFHPGPGREAARIYGRTPESAGLADANGS